MSILLQHGIGLGSTDTTGRNAGVSTATGTMIYNTTRSAGQIYSGDSLGWVDFGNSLEFSATGGTISQNGSYTIHTFTSPGSFEVTSGSGKSINVLVVGGGGGGGATGGGNGAGGGAGSYIVGILTVSSGFSAPLEIGSGGTSGGTSSAGGNGGNTTFVAPGHPVVANGGGGGDGGSDAGDAGKTGGSGGGGGGGGVVGPGPAANPGAVPPAFTYYGNIGGNGGSPDASGGGGGASSAGTNATPTGAAGGAGKTEPWIPSSLGDSGSFAGGGGGLGIPGASNPGSGGLGGGGDGLTNCTGQANTGGGGGGGAAATNKAGGSGIVIVSYLT